MTTLKRFFWMFAGGITGGLLSAGIVLVLMLLISGYGPALPHFGIGKIITEYIQVWTLEKVYQALVIAGIVGFPIGTIAGWKHSQAVQKWFGPVASFGILAILFGRFLYVYASHVEVPQKLKLADCSTSTTKIHLKIPKGRYYLIVLALPSGSTNVFSGHINISDEMSAITNLSIGSSQTEQPCNFLHAQSNYDLEITFDQLPPPSTSIELHWLQTQRDKAE
jgi:hypothetical protein